jgi:WD40 repeat protein
MKGHDDHITSVAFSPDGEQIASASMDKTLQLWNVETCSSIGQPMKGDHKITSIAFSPSLDSKQIASGSGDNTIQLWNTETSVRIGQLMKGHHDEIVSIAFSPDGKQIASGSRDMTI